jgi:hypothetical protein
LQYLLLKTTMGNNQNLMQISSCGFFDSRKTLDRDTNQICHEMDKSLFIDSLSIDDNRNIKKLYSIMDLAR